jgi:hypothetical protein
MKISSLELEQFGLKRLGTSIAVDNIRLLDRHWNWHRWWRWWCGVGFVESLLKFSSLLLLFLGYIDVNALFAVFVSVIVRKALLTIKGVLAHVTFVFVNGIATFARKHAHFTRQKALTNDFLLTIAAVDVFGLLKSANAIKT